MIVIKQYKHNKELYIICSTNSCVLTVTVTTMANNDNNFLYVHYY